MRRLIGSLTSFDAQVWRRVAVSLLLLAGTGMVFVVGGRALGSTDPAQVRHWLAAAHGPWALPAAIGAFAILAFLGAPQIVLIAAAVIAFGPALGAAYSWIGTMVSAMVGFGLGRSFGARAAGSMRSGGLERFMALIDRNGLLASLTVRLVPFAPFIIVNLAAGMTSMRVLDFTVGTAIGIVPKIALMAFAGGSITAAMSGAPVHVAVVLAAVAVWVGAGVIAGKWVGSRKKLPPPASFPPPDA